MRFEESISLMNKIKNDFNKIERFMIFKQIDVDFGDCNERNDRIIQFLKTSHDVLKIKFIPEIISYIIASRDSSDSQNYVNTCYNESLLFANGELRKKVQYLESEITKIQIQNNIHINALKNLDKASYNFF